MLRWYFFFVVGIVVTLYRCQIAREEGKINGQEMEGEKTNTHIVVHNIIILCMFACVYVCLQY